MIYQLKITLKHMKPPVWRRIQVDSKTTFETLHQLIQEAFGWGNNHLHTFEIMIDEGPLGTDRYFIEPLNEDELGLFSMVENLDETEETLEDHLVNEKEKCVYTYNFAEDWEHIVLVEKILQPEEGAFYPRCIKAMPAEEVDVGDGHGPKPKIEIINERFHPFLAEVDPETGILDEAEWLQMFDHIDDFKKRKPWERIADDQIIVVKLPETDEFAYCSVLGQAETEFGLAVYIGPEGLQALIETFEGSAGPDVAYRQRSILISLSDRNELEREDYDLLKRLGLRFRGKKQWPMFRSYKPGYYPWTIDQEEVKLLTIVLEQVIDVVERNNANEVEIPALFNKSLLARVPDEVEGWQDQQMTWNEIQSTIPVNQGYGLSVSEFELKKLKKLPTYDGIIELSLFSITEPVQDRPNERPFFPMFFLVIDQESELVLQYELLDQEDLTQQVQESFVELLMHIDRIPTEVWVENSGAYSRLEPVFNALSMRAEQVEDLPILRGIRQQVVELQM